jgi:ferredoxin-NADP reductase
LEAPIDAPLKSPAPAPAAAAAVARKRIREIEVMVADVIPETYDTTTLVFFTGNDRLDYLPGHFLTIDPHQFESLDRFTRFLEDQKGKKEPPRAYSMCSAPHEKYLAVTVKEEPYITGMTKYPPLLSPLLTRRINRGVKMFITGFTGPYTLPPDIESRTDHLVHLCAGSGVVPNYSIIKHALHTGMNLRHTMIFSNKTWRDVIYRKQFNELARTFPDKFQIFNCLTREEVVEAKNAIKGRVNADILRQVIPDPSAIEVFCCGPGITAFDKQIAREKGIEPPPRFLESALASLAEIGVQKKQIHRESYG